MNFTLPLYVESWKPPHQKVTQHTVRPLFFLKPEHTSERLGKALARCVTELQKTLSALGKEGKHEEVARYAFHPDVAQHRIKLAIEADGELFRFAAAVFVFRDGERKVAFFPALPEVCFELHRGDELETRTQAVAERLFRTAARRNETPQLLAETLTLKGKATIATVDFSCDVSQTLEKPVKSLFALLGGSGKMDGRQELERTGRCLDHFYPDRLATALLRECEVEELFRLMKGSDRRPVLLVGPRRSGKTAVIHDVVRRLVEQRGSAFEQKRNTWLLSPQRLISGMSVVGQWESRLRAILKYAAKYGHTLYFDDLVGTFRAGISRDADLSVSQLLKPCLEERDVRILGEITPEALRVLRERDRTFADLFHLVRVDETDPPTTLRIMLSLVRRLERSHECRFSLDVLPETIDLCRRFRADAAFPGKGADVLLRLAARHRGGRIEREDILDDFQSGSGLERRFLDRRTTLPREEITAGIRQMMVGQEPAVSAVTDVLCLAKAGLQDPRRPLGSLLFLGPTGVGKTQCAKAVARYLFGSAERLIRLDMNEFVSPLAVPRLVGTFDQPEGILTRAVARQPFCVLLLDEIEKAHPDVFDLLLQVLGEARLTDALGRTVDFSHALVVMTSNLGSREASASVGFGRTEEDRSAIYRKAVREFFRPEFVNRIDHIVPFSRLTQEEVLRVSRLILRDVSRRDGLLRRRCLLNVADDVLERVVREGFDPAWGARGVRRALEQHLVRPAACELAALQIDAPTVVTLEGSDAADAASADRAQSPPPLRIRTDILENIPLDPACVAAFNPPASERLLAAIDKAAARMEHTWNALRPGGAFDAARLSEEEESCLTHLDALRDVRAAVRHAQRDDLDDIEERLSGHRSRAMAGTHAPQPRMGRKNTRIRLAGAPHRRLLHEVASAHDVHDFIAGLRDGGEHLAESLFDGPSHVTTGDLIRRIALLDASTSAATDPAGSRVLLLVRGLSDEAFLRQRLAAMYAASFTFSIAQPPDLWNDPRGDVGRDAIRFDRRLAIPGQPDGTRDDEPPGEPLCRHAATLDRLRQSNAAAILVTGEGAAALSRGEAGTHILFRADGTTSLVVVEAVAWDDAAAAAPDESVVAALSRPVTGASGFPPVVRIHEERGQYIDLRTGLLGEAIGGIPSNVNALVLGRLPLPAELR